MNIPTFALRNYKLIYFILTVMLFGGIVAFGSLEKKEDAPFVIKQAVLLTSYSGASPMEVEELVTEPIERQLQTMAGVYKIRSDSYRGLSKITLELDPATPPGEIPQKWDELRRKVLSVQGELPSGVSTITVGDDFGDLYGIYYGMTATEGFSSEDMRTWSELLRSELTTLEGVQKVELWGQQKAVINVFIDPERLSTLGISPTQITQIISSQNQLVASGSRSSGPLELTIASSGSYQTIEDIASQLISVGSSQLALGDIARIEQGYLDPPSQILTVDGVPAIGVGISTLGGYDVVATGERVQQRIEELMPQIPVGIDLVPLYLENEIAKEANSGFILNLVESVGIVILVILLIMGWRAGVLIGSSLLFSIGGTLLIMYFMGTGLNRTSLAGFIIAMGMLVDNAIVVTDNAQISIARGQNRIKALVFGATSVQWGLLGATFIGVASFLPLYLAPSSVAEIVKPLFVVLALSLGLSWILALTQTPLFGAFILKKASSQGNTNPYDKPFYRWFDELLRRFIAHRILVIVVMVVLLGGSLWLMGRAPQSFFPNLDKPYFRADCFLPDGYSIEESQKQITELCDYLSGEPAVKRVSMSVGASPLRYYLASTSFGPESNFGNILVELHTKDSTATLERRFAIYAAENYPDMIVRSSLFKLSPAVEATIEFGFLGENIDTLVSLTARAQSLMQECSLVDNVRGDWGNMVPVVVPHYSRAKGQIVGVSASQMANNTSLSTTGIAMGQFRWGDQELPILLKNSRSEDFQLSNLGSTPIFSDNAGVVPLSQVVDSITTDYQYSVIKHYNRSRVMRAQCDPLLGANAIEAFTQVNTILTDSMTLPQGYQMRVFGEQESQAESNAALAENMPLTLILILSTLLMLFGSYRKPIIIVLMLPLIFIGIVLGLAVAGKSLDFFAILGVLGLVGMNIKNAVVLVDQIGMENASGAKPLDAVVEATKSRIVPVVMASGTTILGMVPLLPDALFAGMASTIMGGLLIASLLTVVVLPVSYTLIMRIPRR